MVIPPKREGKITPAPAVSVLLLEFGEGLLFQYARLEYLKRTLEESATLSFGSSFVSALSDRL